MNPVSEYIESQREVNRLRRQVERLTAENARLRCVSVEHLPQLLTPADAARELRIGCRTVYRLIDRGDLHAVRVGAQLRVPVAAIKAIQEARA